LEIAFLECNGKFINSKASIMTQPEQSPQPQINDNPPPGPPGTVGVYDRPKSKKSPSSLIIAVVIIILLTLLAFWLAPMLF
jgi:hypothetical protein